MVLAVSRGRSSSGGGIGDGQGMSPEAKKTDGQRSCCIGGLRMGLGDKEDLQNAGQTKSATSCNPGLVLEMSIGYFWPRTDRDGGHGSKSLRVRVPLKGASRLLDRAIKHKT